jgi:hypothetical protein
MRRGMGTTDEEDDTDREGRVGLFVLASLLML